DTPLSSRELIPVRRNPRDCSLMDPQLALAAIDHLRAAILKNGVRSVTQTIPWDGRVFTIHIDPSTPQRKQEALTKLDRVSRQMKYALPSPSTSQRQEVDLTASFIVRSEDFVVVQPYKAHYVEAKHGI